MSDEEEEEEGGDSFRLLFVTLSMILLAFFILLNSMATMSSEKQRLALGSLLGAFGLMPGTTAVETTDANMRMKSDSATAGAGFAVFKKMQHLINELSSGNTDTASPVYATFDEQKGEVKVVAADEIVFAKGKAVVSPRMFRLMAEIGRLTVEFDGQVKVMGYSDKTGDKMANWRLSLKRASIVARNIEDSAKLKQGQISAVGHSFYHPITVPVELKNINVTNRRVEILITPRKR